MMRSSREFALIDSCERKAGRLTEPSVLCRLVLCCLAAALTHSLWIMLFFCSSPAVSINSFSSLAASTTVCICFPPAPVTYCCTSTSCHRSAMTATAAWLPLAMRPPAFHLCCLTRSERITMYCTNVCSCAGDAASVVLLFSAAGAAVLVSLC